LALKENVIVGVCIPAGTGFGATQQSVRLQRIVGQRWLSKPVAKEAEAAARFAAQT